MEKIKQVVRHDPVAPRGTLRLWTRIQVEQGTDGERDLFKRLVLQTIHGVSLGDNKMDYVLEFKDLNPGFMDVPIHFEFTLKQYG